MTVFVLIAAVLAVIAVAWMLVPLLRRGSGPARGAAVLLTVFVIGGSAATYMTLSNWSWKPVSAEGTPEGMVGRLARRLERQPEDMDGWLLLGKSYAQLGQYALSTRSYQRADRLADGKNAEALIGMAEALVMGKQGELDGRAGRLFEQALVLEPRSTKALFFSAIAALERGENPLARSRFATLLAANPPEEVREVIQKQIEALDAGQVAAGSTPAQRPVAQPQAPAPAGTGVAVAVVKLHVTLSPQVAAQVGKDAPLFVLARQPGQPGPPLAAKRLAASFPQDVELRSSDAMIQGNGFVAGQEVEVVARVANGGSAISKTGDPIGSARHRVGTGGVVSIVIDRLVP